MRLQADGVDAGVGAAAAGHLHQRVVDVGLFVVDRLGAARSRAMRSRSGKRSMAMTRSAPSRNALLMANWPTGPQPQTATVSPGLMSQFSAAMYPVGKDVGEEQHLFVRQPVLDLERARRRRTARARIRPARRRSRRVICE